MLNIYLLGSPHFESDSGPLHLRRRKGVALVSYLAQTEAPLEREKIATMLWPEHDRQAALKSLRRELARVRKDLGSRSITARRSQLALNRESCALVDVHRFQSHLQQVMREDHFPRKRCDACLEALTTAVELYADDFMAGFNLPDCPQFDAWQDLQRETLRGELAAALHKLALWHASQEQFSRAINYSRRRLALDPLNEEARRVFMRISAEAGQTAQALKLFAEGERLLQEELGVGPDDESRRLYQAIRSGQLPSTVQNMARPQERDPKEEQVDSRPRDHLPRQPTPFIGRRQELEMILLRLGEPSCRLLTLVGPGGIGKTRLALEAARSALQEGRPALADGVHFAPLRSVAARQELYPAVLAAMDIVPHHNTPPRQQLFDYLREKQLLVVLDNLEQIEGAGETIAKMLDAAPGLKILATSRAALQLRDEWFHPLAGLSLPPPRPAPLSAARPPTLEMLRASDALRLFELLAQRASPSFSLAADGTHAARICRLVEGMPLALELAAAWLKVLATHEVAAELEQSFDLLESRLKDVSERHQSMRVVFDQTWAMLDSDERLAIARLSVFRRRFSREAAQEVAGLDLVMLSRLVDKALLYRTTHGRYRQHELLRQYAAGKLREMGRDDESQAAHGCYFLTRLAAQEEHLKGPRQSSALGQITDNLQDIRLAWHWALDLRAIDAASKALDSLSLTFFISGRSPEGVDFLLPAYQTSAVQGGDEERFRARTGTRIALLSSFMSPRPGLVELVETSLSLALDSGDSAEIALAYFVQGVYFTLIEAESDRAMAAYEKARTLFSVSGDAFYVVQVLIWMGFIYGNSARLDDFFAVTRRALRLARETGLYASVAHALGNLVGGAFCVGDYETAEAYAHEVGAIGAKMALANMMTHSRTQLSLANFLKGDMEKAGELAREAHSLATELNHPLSVTFTLTFLALHAAIAGDYRTAKNLGLQSLSYPAPRFNQILGHWSLAIANAGLGRDAQAWGHAHQVFELARPAGFVGLITWPLPVAALLLWRSGSAERAAEVLAVARTHPLSPTGWQDKWNLLAELRGQLQQELSQDAFTAAWQRGRSLPLQDVVAMLSSRDEASISLAAPAGENVPARDRPPHLKDTESA